MLVKSNLSFRLEISGLECSNNQKMAICNYQWPRVTLIKIHFTVGDLYWGLFLFRWRKMTFFWGSVWKDLALRQHQNIFLGWQHSIRQRKLKQFYTAQFIFLVSLNIPMNFVEGSKIQYAEAKLMGLSKIEIVNFASVYSRYTVSHVGN